MRLLPTALGIALAVPAVLRAQSREIQRHDADDAEGRLMAYYSSALAFSPLVLGDAGRFAFDLELSYVPRLSAAQRSAGFDKPEATNLAPAFPRPRLRGTVRGFALEGSWMPPVRTFGVKANLVAGAVTAPALTIAGVALAPRISALGGSVRGPITCNEETAEDGGVDLQVYYASVCHGTDSDDAFEPSHVSLDLLAARDAGPVRAYASFGARRDRTRFDIVVRRPDGTQDVDHPILELRDVEPQFSLGAAWRGRGRVRLGAEWFWAPGSVSTVRIAAGARVL